MTYKYMYTNEERLKDLETDLQYAKVCLEQDMEMLTNAIKYANASKIILAQAELDVYNFKKENNL